MPLLNTPSKTTPSVFREDPDLREDTFALEVVQSQHNNLLNYLLELHK